MTSASLAFSQRSVAELQIVISTGTPPAAVLIRSISCSSNLYVVTIFNGSCVSCVSLNKTVGTMTGTRVTATAGVAATPPMKDRRLNGLCAMREANQKTPPVTGSLFPWPLNVLLRLLWDQPVSGVLHIQGRSAEDVRPHDHLVSRGKACVAFLLEKPSRKSGFPARARWTSSVSVFESIRFPHKN